MRVHLINPSDVSFGVAVITPRWLYVLAAATPRTYGDPSLIDETLERLRPSSIQPGDIAGISIHTGNAHRGYALGRIARERGAFVVFGGIHATLYPEESHAMGAAHAVVRGDGDLVWATVLADCVAGKPERIYEAGRIAGSAFLPGRWNLLPPGRYMWGSVQTLRGCPKHCSFCSVWRTDGQQPRARTNDGVIAEIVELRRHGFRFILLADDNFYPVPFSDLAAAKRRANPARLLELEAIRTDRFELMARMAAETPEDMVFFTQITMEAAEDPSYLRAMRRARIRGALVGVETVTEEGLKAVHKNFNEAGDGLVARLQRFRDHDIQVLGSFIFGLPTDRADTFPATADLAQRAGVAFAQFVMLTPFPGTLDFARWEQEAKPAEVSGIPLTRYWLIPPAQRPKVYAPHPAMSAGDIRRRTQETWDRFYRVSQIWQRAACVRSLRSRLVFVLISKLYRQMYANTGIATDSARTVRSARWARWLARSCRWFFIGRPMPDLAGYAGGCGSSRRGRPAGTV